MLTIAAFAIMMAPTTALADLDWLAGYWLSCADGVEVSESWTDSRSGILLGSGLTRSATRASWEQLRIEPGPEGAFFLHAQPKGQAATRFRLIHSGPGAATFENPGHDFPQRVSYRREGGRLIGQIEGVIAKRVRRQSWTYRRAEQNARCPA